MNTFPVYFTEIKSLWDELTSLCSYLVCDCGSMREILKHEENQHDVELLMGLNESFA